MDLDPPAAPSRTCEDVEKKKPSAAPAPGGQATLGREATGLEQTAPEGTCASGFVQGSSSGVLGDHSSI